MAAPTDAFQMMLGALTVSAETKVHVQEIYQLTCPISQHQKDMRKRRLGPHVVQVCCHPGLSHVHVVGQK